MASSVVSTLLGQLRVHEFGEIDVGVEPRWRHDLHAEIPAALGPDSVVFGRLPYGWSWVRDLDASDRKSFIEALAAAGRDEVTRRTSQQVFCRALVAAITSEAGVLVKAYSASLDPAWTRSDRQRQALVRRHAGITPKGLVHALVSARVKELVPGYAFTFSQEQCWNTCDSELPRGRSRGCVIVRVIEKGRRITPRANVDDLAVLTRASRKDPCPPKWSSLVAGRPLASVPEPQPVLSTAAPSAPSGSSFAPSTSFSAPIPTYGTPAASTAVPSGLETHGRSVLSEWKADESADQVLDSLLNGSAFSSLREERNAVMTGGVGSGPRPIALTAAFPETTQLSFEFTSPVPLMIRVRNPDGTFSEQMVGPGKVTLDKSFMMEAATSTPPSNSAASTTSAMASTSMDSTGMDSTRHVESSSPATSMAMAMAPSGRDEWSMPSMELSSSSWVEDSLGLFDEALM